MRKREVLLAVIDIPGWQPPDDDAQTAQAIDALQQEGWILPRLDGYEATPAALDAFPYFEEQRDIAEQPPEPVARSECVPRERVEAMVAAMLHHLPIKTVALMAAAGRSDLPPDPHVWRFAADIVSEMMK